MKYLDYPEYDLRLDGVPLAIEWKDAAYAYLEGDPSKLIELLRSEDADSRVMPQLVRLLLADIVAGKGVKKRGLKRRPQVRPDKVYVLLMTAWDEVGSVTKARAIVAEQLRISPDAVRRILQRAPWEGTRESWVSAPQKLRDMWRRHAGL